MQKKLLLAIAATCFALIGGALYMQHAKDMLPCPLCVIQRYAILGIGIFSLVAAFARKPNAWLLLAGASAIGGLGTAGKHLYVLAHPGFSCGIDPMETILNKIPTAQYLPWIFRADGLCEAATDTVFGLAIPHWSAIALVTLSVALLVAALRRR
jgi:disulfide bond formation protein DsbB